ncbi:hypothetical protein GCM10027614_08210 [Micromonospora vulcania]
MTHDVPVGRRVAAERTFLGHPRALATLFLTEMWERLSFYGMRAILVLYLTAEVADDGLGLGESSATAVYGTYNAMVYLMALPGGWVADRLIGARRSVLWGGVVIAAGHYVMAVPTRWSVFAGMTLIVLGTGLLKPNISTMVGALYDRDSPAATPASRSSTWASTWAPSSPRWSPATSARRSTGIWGSPSPPSG